MPTRTRVYVTVFVALTTIAPPTGADEGMWLFNAPPRELLKTKYDFTLTHDWLEHAMKASVRLASGSGAFVSPDGLLVTNQHVAADAIQKLNPPDKDYVRDGYYAPGRGEELRCPGLEVIVLQSVVDVTKEVNADVKPEMNMTQAATVRNAAITRVQQASFRQTGLRSDIVVLYQGARYDLYRYKRYTDVRLVMCPEQEIAHFGGDMDNFEFPRHCFDVCFFRAYEDGRPARTPHYFKWSEVGPKDGDLVLVAGHPGATSRLETLERIKHQRDVTLPYSLNRLHHQESVLRRFAERGSAESHLVQSDLGFSANSRKLFEGQFQGLLDFRLMAEVAARERQLRASVEADGALAKTHAGAWENIEKAEKKLAEFETLYRLIELGDAFDSRHFRIARWIVRLAAELGQPDEARLPEYRDAALPSLNFQLYSTAPIASDLEKAKLTGSLTFMAETLGAEHAVVRRALEGKSAEARAEELIAGTKVADPAERRRLADIGRPAFFASVVGLLAGPTPRVPITTAGSLFPGRSGTVARQLALKSGDPMIKLAADVDYDARYVRWRHVMEVTYPEYEAYAKISEARFQKQGTATPPDGTFTLRLAFGTVKGYSETGSPVESCTTIGGLFDRLRRHESRPPFKLPQRWATGKKTLELQTPFNFVSTADTVGGNSGSPVLNRAGELVGVNFDRNRPGLVRNFVYSEERARHISVHSRLVIEVLTKLYDAGPLVAELLGKR